MKINNGVYTALITPFTQSGHVDTDSLKSLVEFQFNNGVKNFVVNGTTAESPTLTKNEVEQIFNVVKSYNSEVSVLLGTGSNSTQKTVEMTKWAESLGVDGALVVVPYYNKPTQQGMYMHFKEVASNTKIPMVLYNVPGRTVVSMNADTAAQLSQIENIVATKEASGDMDITKGIKAQAAADFKILSGDDDSCLDLCLLGGHGVISVVSHLIPGPLNELISKAINKDDSCLTEFKKYQDLLKYLYIEPNPVPAKMALYQMGVIACPDVRLPLVSMTDDNAAKLKDTLSSLELV